MQPLTFLSHTIDGMDLLVIFMTLAGCTVMALANIRKLRMRVERIEQELNIPSSKKP